MTQKANLILMVLSIIAALVAGYVSLFQTVLFGLAGTQWMLIAIILSIYGIYAKMKVA